MAGYVYRGTPGLTEQDQADDADADAADAAAELAARVTFLERRQAAMYCPRCERGVTSRVHRTRCLNRVIWPAT